MAEWLVELTGDKDHLDKLHKEFSSQFWQVIDEDGIYYLRAINLATQPDPETVRLEAQELLSGLKGALLFRVRRIVDIQVGSKAIHIHSDGSREIFHQNKTLDLSIQIPEMDLSLDEIMDLAVEDQSVCLALSDFSRYLDRWANWYKVLDTIENDMGGGQSFLRQAKALGWTDKKELSRFTGPINNRRLLGSKSRHGEKGWIPPRDAMSIDEAEAFIVGLLTKWLQWKWDQRVDLSASS